MTQHPSRSSTLDPAPSADAGESKALVLVITSLLLVAMVVGGFWLATRGGSTCHANCVVTK